MKLWIFLSMLVLAAADPTDLTGQMFTFPKETRTDYVKLAPAYDKNFNALTVCHRSITDLTRDHSLFSLSSPVKPDEVLIYYDRYKKIEVYIHNVRVDYGGIDYAPNQWHSICTTWNSKTGLVQLWFNGQPLIKKFVGSVVNGKPIITLGQDQDRYGSNFYSKESFVGMMSDVHMWDYEISPCEIQKYTEELPITPGNVINWAALDYQIIGNVFVEKKQVSCNSVCLE